MKELLQEAQVMNEGYAKPATLKFDGMTLQIRGKDETIVISVGEGDLKAVLNGFEIQTAYSTGSRSY